MTATAVRDLGTKCLTVPLLALGLTTCARATLIPPPSGPQASAACVIVDTEARSPLRVAINDPVSAANAPVPRTRSERLVFRQLYETLVRVDCDGRVQPALAASWSARDDGRSWQFRIRDDARFSDGTPVTPADVIASWSSAAAAAARTFAGIVSVAEVGEQLLLVELGQPADDVHVFAHAGLAVARVATAGVWPAGITAWRVDAAARGIRLVRDGAVLEFDASPDPRASLDAGVDALVTADEAVLAYARALPAYAVTPLPWDRTYVLAARSTAAADELPPAAALDALATAALRGDARPAAPPFWWRDPACHPPVSPPAPGQPGAPAVGRGAIVYSREDGAGRAIAERLVALAWPAANAPAWLRAVLPADYAARGMPPTAVGLDERALYDALRGGDGLAFIVALPRTGGDVCAAPFVAGDDRLHSLLVGVPGWRITPLLDARSHLVHRGGLGRVLLDGDGALVFVTGVR